MKKYLMTFIAGATVVTSMAAAGDISDNSFSFNNIIHEIHMDMDKAINRVDVVIQNIMNDFDGGNSTSSKSQNNLNNTSNKSNNDQESNNVSNTSYNGQKSNNSDTSSVSNNLTTSSNVNQSNNNTSDNSKHTNSSISSNNNSTIQSKKANNIKTSFVPDFSNACPNNQGAEYNQYRLKAYNNIVNTLEEYNISNTTLENLEQQAYAQLCNLSDNKISALTSDSLVKYMGVKTQQGNVGNPNTIANVSFIVNGKVITLITTAFYAGNSR